MLPTAEEFASNAQATYMYYVAEIGLPKTTIDLMPKDIKSIINTVETSKNVKFQWKKIDFVEDGQLIVFYCPVSTGLALPRDGYTWPSPDISGLITDKENPGNDVLATYKLHGFSTFDFSVRMSRAHYKLTLNGDSHVQLFHYKKNLKVPENLVSLNATTDSYATNTNIKILPAVKTPQTIPTSAMYANSNSASRSTTSKKKKEEPVVPLPSDEIDVNNDTEPLTKKDVAAGRFRRNHDFVNEIFSVVSIPHLMIRTTPKNVNYEEQFKRIEERKQILTNQLAEVDVENTEKLTSIKESDESICQLFSMLTDANTIEELNQVQGEASRRLNCDFVNYVIAEGSSARQIVSQGEVKME